MSFARPAIRPVPPCWSSPPATDGVTANEVYFLGAKELQNHHGGMVMIGDYVYLGHGHNACAPTCIAWKTGKIVWRNNHGPGKGTGHVTYADGDLYFRYENGVMALVVATPKEYEERGRFSYSRLPQAQLAPSGRDRRLSLPARPGHAVLLRCEEEG